MPIPQYFIDRINRALEDEDLPMTRASIDAGEVADLDAQDVAIVELIDRLRKTLLEDTAPQTTTKLWLLRLNHFSGYDFASGFVVRAASERGARLAASLNAGDEGAAQWKDPEKSTCVELTVEGNTCVVLRDFVNG